MSVRLVGDVIVKDLGDGTHWELVEPLQVFFGDKWVFEIEAGFKTNFASVPRFLWCIWPPSTGKYRGAAVAHDWLYEKAVVPKYVADAIMLDLMRTLGTHWFSRTGIFLGVFLFGRWFRITEDELESGQ